MNCPRCGEALKDDARFCSNCGLPVPPDVPNEQDAAAAETLRESDPLVGHVLDGRYELLALLGAGGMGAVYRARRVHIGDEVAVKVLLQELVGNGESAERFRREAHAAAMLRHPNVVVIHDYGEARGEDAPAYIVMELLEGASLRQLLRRQGRFTPERAVALTCEVCAGVGAAHARGVFHRDLKPDNVVVLPPGEGRDAEAVKVIDFGLAKLRDQGGAPTLTRTGTFVGTPFYMSPEQCRGEKLDARSDVYSLGAMLYEMLSGAPPFVADGCQAVIVKHLTEEPRPLRAELGVPLPLEAVARKALAKEAAARPPDATALARELRGALASKRAPVVAVNRLGMELVYVPPGEFRMGSEEGDWVELRVHRVTIRGGFFMGRCAVTQAQWRSLMGNNPSRFRGDGLPVEQVSWYDAQGFVERLNAENDGFVYRLPSEAEWEYACRAGTTGEYAGDLELMAWYEGNSGGRTHPVGEKQPNGFGLHDMHGNVYEWCADYWHDEYEGAPADGAAWLSIPDAENTFCGWGHRVLRGGSYGSKAGTRKYGKQLTATSPLRSAARHSAPPDSRYHAQGFRVAADARR